MCPHTVRKNVSTAAQSTSSGPKVGWRAERRPGYFPQTPATRAAGCAASSGRNDSESTRLALERALRCPRPRGRARLRAGALSLLCPGERLGFGPSLRLRRSSSSSRSWRSCVRAWRPLGDISPGTEKRGTVRYAPYSRNSFTESNCSGKVWSSQNAFCHAATLQSTLGLGYTIALISLSRFMSNDWPRSVQAP